MKHRWSPARYVHYIARYTATRHCIKCGATAVHVMVASKGALHVYPQATYFMPFAGLWQRIWPATRYDLKPGIPKCPGLPANYEAPIGA